MEDDVGAVSGGTHGFGKLGQMAEKLLWTPKRLSWDPNETNELSWGLCFLYAAVSSSLDYLVITLFTAVTQGHVLTMQSRRRVLQWQTSTTATRFFTSWLTTSG